MSDLMTRIDRYGNDRFDAPPAIKAWCPVCGKEVELDDQQLISAHFDDNKKLCNGSHARPIAKVRRKK